MERRTRSPPSSSERWPHRKTTALHGAARHGCEDRERGRQIPTSAESAWECRCKRRRKVRRLIGRRLPYRPMSSRLLSSVDRPTSWPCSSFENTNGRQDKGLWNLCLATWRSRDLLGSEATAGIEPAMKVLQIDGSICEPRYEKPKKSTKSRPLTDPPRTADLCPAPFDVGIRRSLRAVMR